MVRLGPNAYGEQLRPGRVADCYLGILLDQPLAEIAPESGRVLVVSSSRRSGFRHLHGRGPRARGGRVA